jgi:molybdopterin-containing oxidoreductase family membrane subunit
VGTFVGTFGLFFTLFLHFTRVLPIISIGEVKSVLNFARPHAEHAPSHGEGGGHEAPAPEPVHLPVSLPQAPLAAIATRKDLPV